MRAFVDAKREKETMSGKFSFTTADRRASTSVAGSLGRTSLFIPQDFIERNSSQLENALDGMDSTSEGEDNEEDTQDEEEQRTLLANAVEAESSQPLQSQSRNDLTLPPITHSTSVATSVASGRHLGRKTTKQILSEEADLLERNGIPVRRYSTISATPREGVQASELIPTRIMRVPSYGALSRVATKQEIEPEDASVIDQNWQEAIRSGKIQTTPAFEFKTIFTSSIPLIITFLLQSSLGVCSVFAVGHISPKALAGVTLGMMSSNMTAIAVIAGLASSLDTFLPQAYGARKFKLVGLIFQRCVALILCVMVVVCTLWWLYAERVLLTILPDPESAHYAAQYLKVTSFGIPGYVLFETGKRFLQAQGIFDASTYVLFVCAPLNAIMNYTFVWKLGFGYIGAPMAVAFNYTLMALGLFLYTVYTKSEMNPRKCWNGIHPKKIFRNWGELIWLSIPNLIMIVSEFLSFEILTFLASYLGTTVLAAQSVVATMASLTYQVPYGVSIAASTRIANFLGAQLPDAAHVTAKVVFAFTGFVGLFNCSFIFFGRYRIADWFSNDADVIKVVSHVFPVIAFIQIFDALNATSAGCLRGQGMQKIGGYANLISYYLIGIPIGAVLAFLYPKSHPLGLLGLWSGVGLALFIIGTTQWYFVLHADYRKLVEDAIRRNESA